MELSTASGVISKSATKSEAQTTSLNPKVLLLCSQDDAQFLRQFRNLLNVTYKQPKLSISYDNFDYVEQLKLSTRQFDFIFIASENNANLFIPKSSSFSACAGSVYFSKYCILPPLSYFYSVPYANWLFERYLNKGFRPDKYIQFPKFTWERVEREEQHKQAVSFLSDCILIANDIETTPTKVDEFTNEATAPGIACIAFAGLHSSGAILTFVYDCHDPLFFQRIREILALQNPKTFQTGLYDVSNLLRWRCPVRNWTHDTAYFQHSWYSEPPKDLGFMASIYLLDFQYWKKEGKYASSLEEYHRYNAKDSYATLCIAIVQLSEAPVWAKENFSENFPNFFPSLFCGVHGIRANKEKLKDARARAVEELERDEKSLKTMIRIPDFNAGSWQQVQKLLSLFGIHGSGTDEKALEKVSNLHPILEILVGKILDIRANKKAIGTYYTPILLGGRVLYRLNPAGTVTNRLASSESDFWTGTNIQNQPPYAKTYFQADEDFELVEIDNSQSETRCTAYISEEPNLLDAIESGKDFHTNNVTLFFGDVYEVTLAEVKRLKKLGEPHVRRELAKRINHGKSYNMGPDVFLSQVGSRIIEQARTNLKLDQSWKQREVAAYLLSLFDGAYPGLQKIWYPKVVKEIAFTNKLVGATGWTRYFFSQPASSKHALNSAIAHGPQSLSVNILNKAFRRIFWEIQLVEPQNFRMLAQIHDSVFFEVRKSHASRLISLAESCFNNPVTVNGRTLRIPTETKIHGQFWSESGKSGRYKFWKQ